MKEKDLNLTQYKQFRPGLLHKWALRMYQRMVFDEHDEVKYSVNIYIAEADTDAVFEGQFRLPSYTFNFSFFSISATQEYIEDLFEHLWKEAHEKELT